MKSGPVGLLHPGEMGAAVGGALAGRYPVWWASSGRSPASGRRACAAGLIDVGSVEAIRDGCELIISVCPPEVALDVARRVHGGAEAGTRTATPQRPDGSSEYRKLVPATARSTKEAAVRASFSNMHQTIVASFITIGWP